MDFPMAQQVLSEIFRLVEKSNVNMFSLRETPDGFYGTGYEVIVKTHLNKANKQEVYEIAKRYGLRIVERKEELTLYRPK